MNRNEWITQAARLQAADKPFALVTVLRAQAPTSGKAGDKAVVTADGQIYGWIGGGCAQPAVIKSVRRALLDGQPRMIRIAPSDETAERELGDVLEFGMACHSGGTLELFIDPVMPSATLTVVGDSPVARALVGLAPRVGMRVAVVAQGAQAADFPDADTVLATDDVAAVREQLSSTAYVVVATQGRRDTQGLKAALALQPQGLWFVASAKKAGVLLNSLVASGEDATEVGRIIAPAGESIGAQTPEEIALSVLTSVVAARRGRGTQAASVSGAAVPVTATAGAVATMAPVAATAGLAASPDPGVKAGASCCGGAKPTIAQSVPVRTEALATAVLAAETGSCCSGAKASVATAAPVPADALAAPAGSSPCCGG